MSTDITIDAVRLALRVQELRAQTASSNIANASVPGARAQAMDFSAAQRALVEAALGSADAPDGLRAAREVLANAVAVASPEEIVLDAQVSELASAGTEYQALTEALGRQFGLMRLAVTGRS